MGSSETEVAHSPTLAIATVDTIVVKGLGATFTGQIGRAETAIKPGRPAQIEAEPRVRGRQIVQKATVFHSWPSRDK